MTREEYEKMPLPWQAKQQDRQMEDFEQDGHIWNLWHGYKWLMKQVEEINKKLGKLGEKGG